MSAPSPSATTGLLGVVGDPVRHSLSPALHNAAYRALDLDLLYVAFAVPAGQFLNALHGARALGIIGLSVTTPHKADAARYADQRSPLVAALGAANTIVLSSGVAQAESTDGAGLLADLKEAVGFDPAGRSAVVIGAGGAAKGVIAALAQADASQIVICNRTRERAVQAAALAPDVARVGELAECASVDLVINATSIGLSSDASAIGADFAAHVRPDQLVVDLLYRPAESAFLSAAKAKGARIRNGLGMLVHQAALQVALFTGKAAPLEVMWAAVRDLPSD